MPRSLPPDAPKGLRLKPLGCVGLLVERCYYLAEGGAVWCRESFRGWQPPRWLALPAEDLGQVLLGGQTLEQVVTAVTQVAREAPTVSKGRRGEAEAVNPD